MQENEVAAAISVVGSIQESGASVREGLAEAEAGVEALAELQKLTEHTEKRRRLHGASVGFIQDQLPSEESLLATFGNKHCQTEESLNQNAGAVAELSAAKARLVAARGKLLAVVGPQQQAF